MKISMDFYFNPSNELTASISNAALKQYATGFEDALKLKGDTPIILDTNILLGYYGMSNEEKQKLLTFINAYKHRIYITKQIEQEYLKNRLSVIKKDFLGPLDKVPEEYQKLKSQIAGLIKSFKSDKKNLLSKDYPILWSKLEKIENAVNENLEDYEFIDGIKKEVQTTSVNNKNIAFLDSLLDLVSELKTTEKLDIDEIDFLKHQYEALLKMYGEVKINSRWQHAFPGCGESKEDGSGDFIIFHEILKFMKKENTSCVFLTNDVTKGDWLQKDRNQHCHYLEHSFYMTDNIIFIVHAKAILPDISFENIRNDNITPPLLEENGGSSINVTGSTNVI